MGNAQKKSKTDLDTMGNTQFCNFMRGMIKKDTGYGANFEKFNEYCQTNRDSLTNLYLTGTLSDWILMEDPNPDGLSSVPSMEYTKHEQRILLEIKRWINFRIKDAKESREVGKDDINKTYPLIKEKCFTEDGTLALMKDVCNPLCEENICINNFKDRMNILLQYFQNTSNPFYYEKGEKYYLVSGRKHVSPFKKNKKNKKKNKKTRSLNS